MSGIFIETNDPHLGEVYQDDINRANIIARALISSDSPRSHVELKIDESTVNKLVQRNTLPEAKRRVVYLLVI